MDVDGLHQGFEGRLSERVEVEGVFGTERGALGLEQLMLSVFEACDEQFESGWGLSVGCLLLEGGGS